MADKTKFGFVPVRTRKLDEIDTTLYEYFHIKSGATLIYLDREDENKTFAIGFSTPPCDDTGVFHIIEHSVLCGSAKYPLNDPFAELLKGSLNTFLNAITYEDRTIYPVSSRCEKDFINLVDVYMDAVFAPDMLKNPLIFKQEGWRYEYDAESNTLSRNGVVYNEMKGAYSSPDELGSYHLNRALFGGTPYGCDSGGNPDSIPNLSYEMFKSAHEKYYHPSRAKIVLDGKMNIDKLLSLINSHLDQFNKREDEPDATVIATKSSENIEIKYEISEQENEHGKARVLYGFVYSDYTDREASLTASILADILCGSNASPLKKALLDKGIAKDVAMYSVNSRENTLVIEIRDADETRLDEIDEIINNVISSIIKDGINKDNIKSSLNSIEFRLRERDYGTLPIGIVFAMAIYGEWLKGGSPEDALLVNDVVSAVKCKIESNHFEKSLEVFILTNPRKAKVIMLPDKSLAERNASQEQEELGKTLSSMSRDEIAEIEKENEALRTWQNAEPDENALDSIPELTLDDIPKLSDRPSADVCEIDGVKVLRCRTKTNGIAYVSVFLDASDLHDEELIRLSMLSSALLNFPTKNHDPLSLQNDVKANLGSLFASFAVGTRDNRAVPYLKIGSKALVSKADDIIRLMGELLESKIDSTEEMSKIIAQAKSHIEDMILSSGESIALSRAEASRNEAAAISDYLLGYEAYKILSDINGNEDKIKKITESVADLLKKLNDKRRLTVAVTGDLDDRFISELISIFPDSGSCPEKKTTDLCAGKSEFFLLPSKVAYAVIGGETAKVGENLGLMRVARSILSYEYLWNTVRVQNGAYGTGFIPRKNGSLAFYSYRDPSPARSLGFYHESANYLRTLAEEGEDITKFIIGAIGEYDTLITPRIAATISANDYFSGWSADDEARTRQEMLKMTAKDLITVADIIDEALTSKSVVIVGGAEHLDSLEEKPERIIKI